jgi:iron complex outermembrane receptor protein
LAICLPGSGFALAQEPEERPETEEQPSDPNEAEGQSAESAEQTAEERKKAEEEEQAEEPPMIESVTVTATRVETDRMKTPVAVTAFDQETLDQQGVQNVRDLAQLVPNMDIATINGQSTPMISLRGIRSTNETELGDPAVGVHLDGIYSPRMQGILGLMFDNERVEVLRGPQGTLFGRNSTVGNINIISAKPQLGVTDGRVWAQFGNYNAPELQGMVNVPVSDTVGFRFAGRYFQRDSYIDGYWDPNQFDQRYVRDIVDEPRVIAPGSFEQCTSPECLTRTQHTNWWVDDTGDEVFALQPADDDNFYFDAKEWAYRGSLLWQPKNKPMSLNFSFQHFRNDSSGGIDLVNCEKLRGRPTYELDSTNQLVFDEDGNPVVSGVNDCSTIFPRDDTYQAVVNTPGRFFLDIMYLRSQFNWDINENLRFVFLAGGEDQDRESTQDMEQSLNAWDQAMSFLPGTGSRSWMGEAQLQSYGDKKFNWIVGANIFNEKTSTIGFFDNTIDEKSLWDQPDRSTDAWALFAQGTYSFTPRWHLTLGYRHSDETKEDVGGRTYLCTPNNDCAPEVERERIEFAIRFDRNSLAAAPTDLFADPSIYPEFNANDNKGSWTHDDWRIGLDYELENTLLYSYLATGFKAGGIGDVFEGTVVDGDIDDNGIPFVVSTEEVLLRTGYEPEEVITLEVGLKQRFLDGKLNVSGAYFFSDYENMQYASVGSLAFTERYQLVLDPNGNPVDMDGDGINDRAWLPQPLIIAYFTQNVPGAEIQGFELEYDWLAWRGGRIWGYASWLDTEITEDWITKWDYDPVSYFATDFASSVDASNESLRVNLKGNELAVSAPFKFRTTIEHSFVMGRNVVMTPWVIGYWEGDSYLTIWNVDKHTDDLDFVILDQDIKYTDDRREAWSMLHAGLRFYHGDMMMELFAYNLTDEVVQFWGGAAEQVPKGSFSMPRTYGLRFGYKF